VKDPKKLQEKLVALLRQSKLHIQFPYNRSWTDLELREIAWMVEDYVNRDPDVINCDPLKDWVEEYKFYRADSRTS
jgi:hypothetical protein